VTPVELTPPLTTTPAADGFRMPGEFEPHAGTWMLWPCRPDTWRDDAGPA
jgi:agmatine deiminase